MKTKMIRQISMFSILIAQLALPLTANAAESDYEMPGAVAAGDLADDIFTDSLARLPQVRRESLDASGQAAMKLVCAAPSANGCTVLNWPRQCLMSGSVCATAVTGINV